MLTISINDSAEDFISFCRTYLKTTFSPDQTRAIELLFDGAVIWMDRGLGRSKIYKCLGQYIAYIYDKNDLSQRPDWLVLRGDLMRYPEEPSTDFEALAKHLCS